MRPWHWCVRKPFTRNPRPINNKETLNMGKKTKKKDIPERQAQAARWAKWVQGGFEKNENPLPSGDKIASSPIWEAGKTELRKLSEKHWTIYRGPSAHQSQILFVTPFLHEAHFSKKIVVSSAACLRKRKRLRFFCIRYSPLFAENKAATFSLKVTSFFTETKQPYTLLYLVLFARGRFVNVFVCYL